MNNKGEKLYEGKAKVIYGTEDPGIVHAYFKDDATAFNALKKGTIAHKGTVNATVSTRLFKLLAAEGIRTHFIDQPAPNELRLERLEMIPLEVVVRNIAAGSLCKRYGIPAGQLLEEPLVEFFYKADDLQDPMLNDDHVTQVLKIVTKPQLQQIKDLTLKINQALQVFFLRCNLRLVDFKLEYGWDANKDLVLGDEISPDNCRLWDVSDNRVLDKDRFRMDMGDVESSYQEVMKRVLEA
jgi:phosphoribosylaminoimidazole-succinocarboxamide synthase